MSWGAYGVLIIFGVFIVLMIINPNLSCFGKRIKSPFYPLIRKKQMKKRSADPHLRRATGNGRNETERDQKESSKKTEDYGFRLD